MTKSIQQIKQDLNDLESTVAEVGNELENLYQNYLRSLGLSVKQQLILASYQICTQFYAKQFLDLSLSNKQDLQQALRKISIEVESVLPIITEQKELEPEPRELNLMAELIKNLPKSPKKSENSEAEMEDNEAEIDLQSLKAELENVELVEIETLFEDELNSGDTDSEASAKQIANFSNPEHLILWHKQIERTVKNALEHASRKTNRCLQDSDIIPDRIPSKIIDVAIKTDSAKGGRSGHKSKNSPNILHLVIEGDADKNKLKSTKNITQVSLLRLRTAELEFSDPLLNIQRNKIRNLMSKIGQLNNQYKTTKKEAEVAEAEAAWRSSWYED
jgi:DNA polymerase III delta prime subunit